jgi:hypothetical protein
MVAALDALRTPILSAALAVAVGILGGIPAASSADIEPARSFGTNGLDWQVLGAIPVDRPPQAAFTGAVATKSDVCAVGYGLNPSRRFPDWFLECIRKDGNADYSFGRHGAVQLAPNAAAGMPSGLAGLISLATDGSHMVLIGPSFAPHRPGIAVAEVRAHGQLSIGCHRRSYTRIGWPAPLEPLVIRAAGRRLILVARQIGAGGAAIVFGMLRRGGCGWTGALRRVTATVGNVIEPVAAVITGAGVASVAFAQASGTEVVAFDISWPAIRETWTSHVPIDVPSRSSAVADGRRLGQIVAGSRNSSHHPGRVTVFRFNRSGGAPPAQRTLEIGGFPRVTGVTVDARERRIYLAGDSWSSADGLASTGSLWAAELTPHLRVCQISRVQVADNAALSATWPDLSSTLSDGAINGQGRAIVQFGTIGGALAFVDEWQRTPRAC